MDPGPGNLKCLGLYFINDPEVSTTGSRNRFEVKNGGHHGVSPNKQTS